MDETPRVTATPELLNQKHRVERRDGETDAEYQSRVELFELLLKNARGE